ncbi:hypothetical protein [Paenibacillus hamazuiensis]|uniref:hypothetical protein n=1 Tax=Paenibacillus hamazuiensis TaxID=2936508 RepID=UPI00200D1DB6|nr:hypothetical protein [Paenibacillus hamazuiensis]
MAKFPILISEDDELHNKRAIRHIAEEFMMDGQKVTRIHTAWKLESGPIMVYEYMSANNPSGSICFLDSLDDYFKACEEVNWLTPMVWSGREK